jgi:hypothetical protein
LRLLGSRDHLLGYIERISSTKAGLSEILGASCGLMRWRFAFATRCLAAADGLALGGPEAVLAVLVLADQERAAADGGPSRVNELRWFEAMLFWPLHFQDDGSLTPKRDGRTYAVRLHKSI